MSPYFCCPVCQLPCATVGLAGCYQPVSGGNPIQYRLCQSCAGDIAGASEFERAELFYKVELFMEGRCYEAK
jgi:protein-arginine kinase activator protein McsA